MNPKKLEQLEVEEDALGAPDATNAPILDTPKARGRSNTSMCHKSSEFSQVLLAKPSSPEMSCFHILNLDFLMCCFLVAAIKVIDD